MREGDLESAEARINAYEHRFKELPSEEKLLARENLPQTRIWAYVAKEAITKMKKGELDKEKLDTYVSNRIKELENKYISKKKETK